MKTSEEFREFKRQCYLRSVPSVDLNDATPENPIDCTKHELLLSEYEKILEEFEVEPNTGVMGDCNMWVACCGPHIIND